MGDPRDAADAGDAVDVGGDAACWMEAVCADCGRLPDPPEEVDADGRCPTCAEAARA